MSRRKVEPLWLARSEFEAVFGFYVIFSGDLAEALFCWNGNKLGLKPTGISWLVSLQ
jgi:hypothetical protein